MSEWSKVLEKAQKIRDLRDRAGTPEEAAVASEKLQLLLIKHQIAEYELDGHKPDAKHPVVAVDVDVDTGVTKRRRITRGWRRLVMFAAAEAHGCKAVSWHGSSKMTLVGYQTNVDAAQDLNEYLRETILRLTEEAWQRRVVEHGIAYKEEVARWTRSFAEGAIDTVRKRLRAARREAEQAAAATSQALVVMNQDVADKYAELFPNLTTNKRSSVNSSAYHAGAAAGHGVQLGKSVSAGGNKAIR